MHIFLTKSERPPTYAEAVPEADPGEWSRLHPHKEHHETDTRVVIVTGALLSLYSFDSRNYLLLFEGNIRV
jgi:hypothetical protein